MRSFNQIAILQPNRVTEAKYDFSAIQHNILYIILHRIQQDVDHRDRMNQTLFNEIIMDIPLKELDASENYKHIFLSAKELIKKEISFKYKDEQGRTTYVATSCLSTVRYTRGTGTLKIYVTSDAVTALAYIGEGFTRYQLKTAISLKSKYSKRLYELCSRWKDKGQFFVTIQRFRDMFSLSDSYKDIKALKRRVLEPGQEELRRTADIYFTYRLVKGSGRAYETIYFTVLSKKDAAVRPVFMRSAQASKKSGHNKTTFLLQFLDKWYPAPPVPGYVCEVLQSNQVLDKAYKRFSQLDEEYKRGEKKDSDLKTLVPFILEQDYAIKGAPRGGA